MVPLGICTSWYLLKDYEDEDLSEDEDEDLSDGHHIEYNILGVLSHARSLKLVAPLREVCTNYSDYFILSWFSFMS